MQLQLDEMTCNAFCSTDLSKISAKFLNITGVIDVNVNPPALLIISLSLTGSAMSATLNVQWNRNDHKSICQF